jgi:hypothetical protein
VMGRLLVRPPFFATPRSGEISRVSQGSRFYADPRECRMLL